MSRLAPLYDALDALDLCLYAHGPACGCTSCTACRQARALVLRLTGVLQVLTVWSRCQEADEPILPADLAYLLDVVLVDDHPARR